MNPTMRAPVLAVLSLLSALPAGAQTAAPAASQTAVSSQRVSVNDISVIGNTLLQPALVEATLAPWKGQRTIDEIRQAAQALQDLYRQAGYGAVVTFLPEQAVAGGKLVIGVLEGRVARVTVIGQQRFSVDNVRRSVPALVEGKTPPVRRIDAQVQLANENPARKLALTLEPGAQRGEVDAVLNVTESSPTRWLLSAENTGNAQTGRLRLGLGYQHAALWDRDHQLSVQAQFSPEHLSAVRVFSASYRVPVYEAGIAISAYATYSSIDAGTTATAAGALQFNGKGRVYGLSATRLLERVGEFDQRLTLTFESRDYLNNCTIQGLPPGACGSAGESVTVTPLTLDYSVQRGGERPLAGSLALAHNLALGGGRTDRLDAVRPGAKKGYTVLRAQAYAAWPLGGEWQLSARGQGQATGDALVAGEQFGAAGTSAVRGYEEREVTGDSGLAASLELMSPGLASSAVRAVLFGDAGSVRNRLGTACNATQSRCSVAAMGVGARFALGPSQWRIDVAQALKDGRTTERRDVRVHFQASLPFE